MALVLLLPACSADQASEPGTTPASSSAPAEAGPAPHVASAVLEDATQPAEEGRAAWSTTWRACFALAADDPAAAGPPDAVRWQSQAVTTEGASPAVEQVPGGCLDLVVARGVNAAEAGTPGREVALADAANLAYRVRAVRPDGTVTPWSQPVRVTSVLPPA
ncbi:hypothetical protein [Quadrisphaera sp. DSM 44207]|uniref:hypothetical protein n=1 Tax=Quadrisphaera sp. DSM 44207 TaxID=1881057 RepID=UPI000880666B|nr:hypothetical protein [Quadrisphaera sp. DSM 44207]SDQ42671.1 hypothetical protein SAMN05428996_1660 [Quadrisphaera sp. DSM 44207]